MPRNNRSTKEIRMLQKLSKIIKFKASKGLEGHWMNNSSTTSKQFSRKSVMINVLFIMSSAYCSHSVVFMFYVGVLNGFPLEMLSIWIIQRWRGFITRRTISGI